jgi:ketosteroid isomerase-like protein
VQETNYSVVRGVLEAFDGDRLTDVLERTDPSIVVDWSRSAGTEAGVYRGRTQALRFLGTFHEVFERICSEPRALLECGDCVVVPTRTRLWGREGVQVRTRHVALVRLREGRIVNWRLCLDENEAVAALESSSPTRWGENLDIVRRAIDAFSRGELHTALRDADPEAVVDWTRSPGLDRGVYRGHEQARRFMGTFHELFERVQVDPEEMLIRGDTVIVPTCMRVRGRYGIELETRHASLFRLRHGLIVLWRFFMDRTDALAEVDLQDC